VNTLAPDGFPPLALASFFGHPAVAEVLLVQGARVDTAASNAMKVTALHAAAANRHTVICAMLLQHGADVNARQHGGFTPLHAAAANGQEELVRLLLELGADRSLKSEAGHTPRDLATEKGHPEVAKLL
jgi:ankyrin repeat protein